MDTKTSSHLPLKVMYSVKEERRKQREIMEEIERAKMREQKAIEKAEREERMEVLARERARAEFQEWEKKEEEFCFKQIKARAEIRIREGCIKPIDVLSMHLDKPFLDFESLAKAILKEYHAKMLCKHLQKDNRNVTRQEVDAGYDEKYDQTESEEAEESEETLLNIVNIEYSVQLSPGCRPAVSILSRLASLLSSLLFSF